MFSEKLLTRLKDSYSVVALSSNGISAETGIPAFRGKNELWKDMKVEEIASIETLNNNPGLFWEYYVWTIQKLKTAKPNLGHYSLVDLERFFKGFLLFTENVDNLHSNIYILRCTNCGEATSGIINDVKTVPKCKKCSGLLRPNVLLFGEEVNQKLLSNAQEVSSNSDVFIAVGTSEIVEPAASLPFLAKANGAFIIEINSKETSLTPHADEYLYGTAVKILPQLIMFLEKII